MADEGSVAPKERVNIVYKPDTGGMQEEIELPLRILDLSPWIEPMAALASYPYLLLRAPAGSYVPAGVYTIGSPDLLLCRPGLNSALVATTVNVLATDAPQLMPPEVRGLQYLQPPSMIQTGRIPLHPGAIEAYRALHG